MTASLSEVELPVGTILNQIGTRRVEVTLPGNYVGPLYCMIATPGVSGSEVYSAINITGKCKEYEEAIVLVGFKSIISVHYAGMCVSKPVAYIYHCSITFV